MAVDCIPHVPGKPAPYHVARHHHVHRPIKPVVIKAAAKPNKPRRHVRLRECAPGATVAPLADLDNDNVAAIYMLPYAGPVGPGSGGAVSRDAAAVAPAEASGLDLPVGGLSDIGALGGGSGGSIGLPPGFASPGSGSGLSGGGGGSGPSGGGSGGGGGGATGGGSASGGGSSGSGGTGGVGPGGGPGTGPVIIGVPPGGGGTTTGPGSGGFPGGGGSSGHSGGGPSGSGPGGGGPGGGGLPAVPEPATWALMLIGVGAIGGLSRRNRCLAISA